MRMKGLKAKILLLTSLPTAIIIFICLNILQQSYLAKTEVERINKLLVVIDSASMLAHFSQIERGLSASYLKGGIEYKKLAEHKTKNNSYFEDLNEKLQSGILPEKIKSNIKQKMELVFVIRNKISKKRKDVSVKEMLSAYTQMIQSLLDLQIFLSQNVTIASISLTLKSLRVLEEAKESGGKFRANVSGIFAANIAIPFDKLQQILNLNAGLIEGLKSKGLSVSNENQKVIAGIFKSNNWKEIDESFSHLIKNYQSDGFGKDPKRFFSEITSVLDNVNNVILAEKKLLKSNLHELKTTENRNFYSVLIGLILGVSILILITFFIGDRITKKVMSILEEVNGQAINLNNLSNEVSEMNSSISSATTEQAACVQEAVASINEIQSMVRKNVDSANSSKEVSESSKQTSDKGITTIRNMVNSFGEISASSELIAKEVEKGNTEIEEIVEVISKIEEKTKIINEIVFQTKLLSFNASVEAARAGEHGKGFAVVAEEVGSLADMSGNAAIEITELLQKSILEVKNIVSHRQVETDKLFEQNRLKMLSGKESVESCETIFENISKNITILDKRVEEILVASKEQSEGINEINKAIQELDETTHSNSANCEKSSFTAKSLDNQAEKLNKAILLLTQIIIGDKELKRNHESSKSNDEPNNQEENKLSA